MQITSLDYSSFLGRIAVGKVARGAIREGQNIILMQADGSIKKSKVKELYVLILVKENRSTLWGYMRFGGLMNFNIGDTICDPENTKALPLISVDAQ
jgi:GTP-binding protein